MSEKDFVSQEKCDILHNTICKEMEKVEKKTEIIEQTSEQKREDLKNKIVTTKESLNSRLDAINSVICGDVKGVGILEQIRDIKRKINIILGLAILIFGGKFIGIELNNIKEFMFPKETIIKVEEIVKKVPIKKEIIEECPIVKEEIIFPVIEKEIPIVEDNNNIVDSNNK